MKTNALMLAALVALATAAPVFAEDKTDMDDAVTQVSLIPARVLGVATGVGLGVPIATTRATIERTGQFQQHISKSLPDQGSPANTVYSAMFALPAGLAVGLVDGVYCGARSGLTTGFDHPFSAESMSLGDDSITQ
jgi:hypothetical protein